MLEKLKIPEYILFGFKATLLAWVGAGLTLISHGVYLAAFFTPSWGHLVYPSHAIYSGLWTQCTETYTETTCTSMISTQRPGYVWASQLFCCVVFIGYILQSVSMLLYIFLKPIKRDKRMAFSILCICGTNVILVLMISVVYGCGFTSQYKSLEAKQSLTPLLSYSYGLLVVSLIIHAIVFVNFMVEITRTKFQIPL